MSESSLPLVTFAIFAYNQESFISEAIEGALSQDYENLEIIISDDCSSDGTFELIEKLVWENGGGENIRAIRNEKNLGLIEHINNVVSMSSGELIVVAAGDDISLPNRTSVLVKRWLDGGKRVDSLHSAVIKISDAAEEIGLWRTPLCKSSNVSDYIKHSVIIGATHAWTKRCFDFYGPIRSTVSREDRVIGFRSIMLGGVEYIDFPLVRYRLSGMSNTCYGVSNDRVIERETQMYIEELTQNFIDVCKLKSPNPETIDEIGESYRRVIDVYLAKSGKNYSLLFYLGRIVRFSRANLRHILECIFPDYFLKVLRWSFRKGMTK